MVLRNVVPRQGTETSFKLKDNNELIIEKCSSPTGDGNAEEKPIDIEAMIEKCSSPTGDGNAEYDCYYRPVYY